MKIYPTRFFYFLFVTAIFTFLSCGPTIHYIGNSYAQNDQIDIFYSEKDVEKPYRTIGKMTHDKFIDYSADLLQSSMVAEAKVRGADGIIFNAWKPNNGSTATMTGYVFKRI